MLHIRINAVSAPQTIGGRRFHFPFRMAWLFAANLVATAALAQDGQAGSMLETIPVQAEQEREPAPAQPTEMGAVVVRSTRNRYAAGSATGGTKTDTPIMENPMSVSVITREQIEDQGAQTVQDTLRYSAGVRSDAFGLDSRGDWAYIRGTQTMYYLDGLRMLYASYNTVRPDPWTLDSVEIVRGPASVLYGQGPAGGIVALGSKLPQAQSAHDLRAEIGNYDRLQYALDSTGSLTQNGSLSYRLTGLQRDSGTQVDYVDDDRWLVAPSLSWTPTDWLQWTVLGRFQEDNTGSTTAFLPWEGSVLPNRNGRIPTSRFTSEPDFDRYDMKESAVTSLLELRLGERWSFRQNLRWTDSEGQYRALFPNVYTGDPYLLDPLQRRKVLRISTISDTETHTLGADQQLQGRLTLGPTEHLLLVGYDYGKAELDELYGSLASQILDVIRQGRFDLYEPVYGRYIAPDTAQRPRSTLKQEGFYLQGQVRFGEHWIAVLGARHDKASSLTGGTVDREDSETSLRAGLLYRFDTGFSPYASYAESFEPVAGNDEANQPYKPVRGKQVEAGLKYQPPGSTSLYTLAIFDLKQQNRLSPGPNPRFQVQLGEADIQGLEFEGSTSFARRIDLMLNYTWLDAEADQGPEAEADARYKALAGVAEHVASFWARWRFAIAGIEGFSLGAGVRYIGETTDEGRNVTVPAITLLDALAAWEGRRWRVAVNGTNLEDDSYVSTCLERGDCFYGSRRNLVGSIAYRF